jgi:CDP-diglyceride synthetase
MLINNSSKYVNKNKYLDILFKYMWWSINVLNLVLLVRYLYYTEDKYEYTFLVVRSSYFLISLLIIFFLFMDS